MKARVKAWHRRTCRRIASETHLTGWRFAGLCVLRPIRAARYGHLRFKCWACLPGDVFEDFQRDACLVVIQPRPREVLCAVVSNQLIEQPDAFGVGLFTRNGDTEFRPAVFDHRGIRPAVVTETIPRDRMRGWLLPTSAQRRVAQDYALLT